MAASYYRIARHGNLNELAWRVVILDVSDVDELSSQYRSSLHYLKTVATYLVELLPTLADVRILRQWAGLCDLTPDMCPLLGPVESLKGFVLDCGWGTFGFRAVPAAGLYLAEYIDTGNMPEIIQPFTLSRIYAGNLIDEAGSAASGIS